MEEINEGMDMHLKRIADALLLNGLHCDRPGLLDGRMGIALFFYRLGRKYRNEIYTQYAGELVDTVIESLDADMSVDFESGLAGIGWGIGYSVRHGFIAADTDEVLGEFDDRISGMPAGGDATVHDLIGAALYYIMRLSDRSPDASAEIEASLRAYAGETLEQLEALIGVPGRLPGSQCLQKFRVEWPYPWLLYVTTRFGELGVVADRAFRMRNALSDYVRELLQREMHPVNAVFLRLVLDRIGYPHELPAAGVSYGWPEGLTARDGKAGLLLLIHAFAAGDSRYAPLTGVLNDEISDALDGMALWSGCRLSAMDPKIDFGLLDGIAGIGLAKIL